MDEDPCPKVFKPNQGLLRQGRQHQLYRHQFHYLEMLKVLQEAWLFNDEFPFSLKLWLRHW